MCLQIVTKKHKKALKGERKVWKAFSVDVRGHYSTSVMGSPIVPGKWERAGKERELAGDGVRYEAGFHCFATKAGALECAGQFDSVLPCLAKDIVVEGIETQWKNRRRKVIVARQLKVLPYKPRE